MSVLDIKVTVPEAVSMVTTLEELHDALSAFHAGMDSGPSPGSQAANELSGAAVHDLLEAAFAQSNVLAEAAADHAMAFTRTLHDPIQTIAPWACTRSALEASALSCWLFDPDVDARSRCGRSLAFRFEGVSQEQKYARAKGDHAAVSRASEVAAELEREARALGFAPVRDKKGRRIGVAQRMPSATQLMGSVLDEESTYRLLSGVAHAHVSTLSQVGFRRVDTGDALYLEKDLNPLFVAYLCLKCIGAVARPIWLKCRMYGGNEKALFDVLESAYESLPGQVVPARFWIDAGVRQPG